MDAKSVMTTNVVSVGPDAHVEVIANLLLDKRISAVPVVNKSGAVIGMVSEGDLMRRPESETEPRHSWWLSLIESPADRAADYLKTHGLSAEQIMTRNPVTVSPDTLVSEIADILERRHIKRVPVVADNKLVGIVSRADLLRALATHKHTPPTETATSDQALREHIIARLHKEQVSSGEAVNPIVTQGKVQLWGHVNSREEREAVRLVVTSVDGVKSVENNLGILDGMARQVMGAE